MANQHRKKRKPSASRNTNSMKPLLWITVGFAAVIILLVVLTALRGTSQDRFSELPSLEAQQVRGNENAAVTVVEFGDYMCPTCMVWDRMVYPQLHKDYIATGKVQYVFINTLFHGQPSELAALASESVFEQSPEHFWAYHDAIFTAQANQDSNSNWVTPELLLSLAEEHVPGIDLEKLEADLVNKAALPKLVIDMDLVDRYEVKGTPTVMINGIVMNNPMDYEEIRETIEQELEAGDK